MDVKELQIIAATSILVTGVYLQDELHGKKRRKRSVWVKNWLQRREEKGAYNNILTELRLDDVESFRKYLRMNTDTFQVSTTLFFFFNCLLCDVGTRQGQRGNKYGFHFASCVLLILRRRKKHTHLEN